MSFFDPPDEKLRKNLAPDTARRASMVVQVAEHYGAELSFGHRRELAYVVFMAWLEDQLQRFGMHQLNRASLAQYATCSDQAHRIGGHFTPAQGAAFDVSVRHIKALPEEFEPQEQDL